MSAKQRSGKRSYPTAIDLVHPTEGHIVVYVLPQGRVATIKFEERAFLCSD